MKRFLLSLVVVLALTTLAQDFEIADNSLSFSQIEQQWGSRNLFTITRSEYTDVREYFLSFVQAYPNEPCNLIIADMLGMDTDGLLAEVVVDKANGYISAYLLTELMPRVQMCHWRCSDGGTLIAVAFTGVEYSGDDNIGFPTVDEDGRVVNITGMQFYRIDPDEVMWQPRTLKSLSGRAIKLSDYNIELPRKGKNIVLKPHGENKPNVTLVWNGNSFSVK